MENSDMSKRNRIEIGRFVAVILAAVVAAILPLRMIVSGSASKTDKNLSMLVDGFTSNVCLKKRITVSDYEEVLSALSKMGNGFELSISVEREAQSIADKGEINIQKAMLVAAHVHGPECYAGHNHLASGCRFHTHTPDCRCSGTFTKFSYTESGTSTCGMCNGTGKTGSISVCPTCKGKDPDWTEVVCPFCDGEGIGLYSVWHVCPHCNGAGCNVCDEGKPGGWYKEEYDTCRGCRGRGTVLDRIPCSVCNGKGTVGEIKTCSSCSGRGYRDNNTSHYTCSACGMGDSTIYGYSCGRLICGMDFESYECGITNEDTVPRCDKIIVDADYNAVCHIRQFDTPDMVDTTVRFTYLNGDIHDIRTKLAGGTDLFDSSKGGELDLRLSYTGYFERADNYETRYFPIHVVVDRTMAKCEKCGRDYYLNDDGSDPGCPYCVTTGFTIRVDVNGDVIKGGVPDINVLKISGNEEMRLEQGEYTLFYDSDSVGEREAAVYYSGYWEYFTINVVPDPNEESGGGSGNNGENGNENTGGSSDNGSGNGGGNGNDGGSGESSGNGGGSSEGNGTGNGGNTGQGGNGNGNTGTDDNSGDDHVSLDPESIEDNNELKMGKYIFIPDDEIVSMIYSNGLYELCPGDLLNVTIRVTGKNTIDSLLQILFIPERIKEKYSSGMIV